MSEVNFNPKVYQHLMRGLFVLLFVLPVANWLIYGTLGHAVLSALGILLIMLMFRQGKSFVEFRKKFQDFDFK